MTHRAELAAPISSVASHACRASCWRRGLPPCVRPNFSEQSGLFRSNSGLNGKAGRL
jgi:hypothetical protein